MDGAGSTAGTGVEVRGITKRYGKVTALAGVDLAVREGEFLTILGPSGSGKTTLLKVVAGFEVPEAGAVRLGGRDITDEPPARRNIGMVFQHYALFPHMSVAQNIAFPLEMRRVAADEIRRRTAEVLELVELRGFEARLPAQLSGGQQQRVALARAIVFQPRLLLLDEPFGALDRKLRESMQLEVRRLQRRLGLTTLFITHDQEEALVLSDRIAVMNEGAIAQVGAPEDIYERPANSFVADFVGESNLLDGRVAAADGDVVTVRTAGGQEVRAASARALPVGSEVKLLIRPERLVPDGDERRPNRFVGRVVELVYLGQSWKARIALDGKEELLARWPVGAGSRPGEVGTDVRIACGIDDVRLVDRG